MATPTLRKRDIATSIGTGTLVSQWRVGGSSGSSSQSSNHGAVIGTEITSSEGHPFASRKKTDKLRDLGGDFSNVKSYMVPIGANGSASASGWSGGVESTNNYSGPILPRNPRSTPFPTSLVSSADALDELGATAVARCKPTNSVADASTFLGELYKDRFPDLVGSSTWRDRTITSRNAGEEFLNAQFGWLPLVNDVKKFSKAARHADTVLRQYERDAGKVVRRRYEFPEHRSKSEHNFGEQTVAYYGPSSTMLHGGAPSKVVVKVETFRRQWFSGAFTYGLPSGYDSRKALARYALLADKVYGLSLTPDTLWELSPWSWAADWFTNTGDVISNISSWQADGLVMVYGYIMEHTLHKATYTQENSGLLPGNRPAVPFTMVTETKVRRRANPFGFGVTWDGLSPIQVAIAAAIGLTR